MMVVDSTTNQTRRFDCGIEHEMSIERQPNFKNSILFLDITLSRHYNTRRF